MNVDYKHLIAVVVGIVLGVVSTHFGLDLSKSCPAAPVVVAPVAASVVK